MNTKAVNLVDAIDALLPQTQCTKCSYEGCRPYAQAIAQGEADINQCPPGGDAGIAALAQLLARPIKPLNPSHGSAGPRKIAVIDPARCIGCTLCIQACPVDAILGAPKWMHTVVPEYCTGCDLCLAPCPVDCIDLIDIPALANWTQDDAYAARQRFEQRKNRQLQEHKAAEAVETAEALPNTTAGLNPANSGLEAGTPPLENRGSVNKKQQIIQAALERARLRRAKSSTASESGS